MMATIAETSATANIGADPDKELEPLEAGEGERFPGVIAI